MRRGPFRLERPEVGPMLLLLVLVLARCQGAISHLIHPYRLPHGAALCGVALLCAVPAYAQFDSQAFERWGSEEVLKYTVVANFEGTTAVVIGGNGYADVKDRFEIEFRWNQYQAQLVGEPVIRNYPAEIANIHGPDGCDTPSLTGPYDLATVTAAAPGYSADLHLTVRTELAPAIAPINCIGKTAPTAGEKSEDTVPFPVHGIAMWGLPKGTMPNISASGDSLTVRDGNWTYVYTLSKD